MHLTNLKRLTDLDLSKFSLSFNKDNVPAYIIYDDKFNIKFPEKIIVELKEKRKSIDISYNEIHYFILKAISNICINSFIEEFNQIKIINKVFNK